MWSVPTLPDPVNGLFHALRVFFSWLGGLFGKTEQLHKARFARKHELSGLECDSVDGTALLLGAANGRGVYRVRSTEARPELGNLLVVAPTRGGKGLLAISQLLSFPHSVVVNDIKGELFKATAGERAKRGPVFVLDTTGIGNRYDPLVGRCTEDELFSSATHLLFKSDEGDGAIFTQRATVMLTQLFLAAEVEEYPALPYVRQMVRLGLEGVAERLHLLSPILATQFLNCRFETADFDNRFLQSAWDTLYTRMYPLLTETVVRSLARSDFRAGDLMTSDRPVTIYLRWPERDLLALSPLVRLIWGSLIDELITTYDRGEGRGCKPVLLLIDEAGRTAIPSLAEYATTVVGRGITLWVAVQALSQLEDVYGRARANTIRNNMESQLFYRPADQVTADFLEHRLGRRSDFAHSRTLHEGTETSQNLSEQGVPLLTAQEIMQLTDTEVIAFHRNLPPFRARRMDWRRFPRLAERCRISPPSLSVLPPLPDSLPAVPWSRGGKWPMHSIDPDVLH